MQLKSTSRKLTTQSFIEGLVALRGSRKTIVVIVGDQIEIRKKIQ